MNAEDREKLEKLAAEYRERNDHGSNEDDFKPKLGMEFATRDEAHKFISLYAFVVGFSVSVVSSYRTASRRRNKEVIRFTMKCNKYGRKH